VFFAAGLKWVPPVSSVKEGPIILIVR